MASENRPTPASNGFFDLHAAQPEQARRARSDFELLASGVLARAGADAAAIPALCDRLWRLMSAPGRHYHTPVHVLSIFEVAREQGLALRPDQELALLFHDAVYDARGAPGASEERSAELLLEQLPRAGVPSPTCESAAGAIRSTARHAASDVPSEHALVLDLDLAGLASEEDSFRRQSDALQAEQPHLSPDDYRRNARALLESLLARPRIYRSPELAHLEPAARENVRCELRRLREESEDRAREPRDAG